MEFFSSLFGQLSAFLKINATVLGKKQHFMLFFFQDNAPAI
jgi:hypothetical protein